MIFTNGVTVACCNFTGANTCPRTGGTITPGESQVGIDIPDTTIAFRTYVCYVPRAGNLPVVDVEIVKGHIPGSAHCPIIAACICNNYGTVARMTITTC